MKGIVHFTAGVAIASFFPQSISAGMTGNPLYFILGGVAGLLPDTLDFKVIRFFWHHDIEIIPDPLVSLESSPSEIRKQTQSIANGIAEAINIAHFEKRTVSVKLNTIQTGAGKWQAYQVKFDASAKNIVVRYIHDAEHEEEATKNSISSRTEGRAQVACELKVDYKSTITVDFLDGPTLYIAPLTDGRVSVGFIPWHRLYSHNLFSALLFSIPGYILCNFTMACIIFLAFISHIFIDQLGFMGSSVLFPFSRRRIGGIRGIRSESALANFAFFWMLCVIILWNLCRHDASHAIRAQPEDLPKWIIFGLLIPFSIMSIFSFILKRLENRSSGKTKTS